MESGSFYCFMKSIFLNIKSFTDGVSKNNISAHAAASAFYMFLSLVPFVALITTILPLTGLQQDKLFEIISRYIPSAMQALINSTLTDIYSASDAVLPITVITTIWLSSRAFSSLIRGVEDIADSPRYSSYLKRSLLACLYTIGIISVMVILLFLLVFGHRLSTLPLLSPFVRLIIELRFLVAAIILSLVFIAVYHWVPGMRLKFTELLPGAATASGAWLLFTWMFSLYIVYSGGFSTYGNLAAIIITLLWMYWCMYIILLGAYLNMFIYRKRRDEL